MIKKTEKVIKKCANCDKNFPSKRTWHKYCSRECRLINWAIRRQVFDMEKESNEKD